ncbi:hypothetical protein BOX15_Mlig013956g1 [Macrostomum lignano]|uniref:Uncharacterized protein n=3 Tax=Macrostomum lignano TaxID=282301 RepID=A0A267FZ11_9PLAT|nr:hypothetical protein BOX15_Mlig028620g1 [Macrostomum lignano]PAA79074.1 hypothetical protein BOX15_Mlig013956g1 [Macrostomum lignano]
MLLLSALTVALMTATVQCSVITCARQLSSCSCETADGGVIDLSPLSSPSGYPFSASASGGQDTFRWSPCVGQLCGNQFDTAVCEFYGSSTLPVGTASSAKFVTNPARGLQLVYTDNRAGLLYTSSVILACDPDAERAEFSAEGGVYDIFMHLRSKHACVGGGGGGGGGDGGEGISTGDILCIIFLCGLVLYLSLGLMANKFILGKEGSELMPNKNFWIVLPGYVRDGFLFTIGKLGCYGGGIGRSSAGYEAV